MSPWGRKRSLLSVGSGHYQTFAGLPFLALLGIISAQIVREKA
jgi:hypothetical protein